MPTEALTAESAEFAEKAEEDIEISVLDLSVLGGQTIGCLRNKLVHSWIEWSGPDPESQAHPNAEEGDALGRSAMV